MIPVAHFYHCFSAGAWRTPAGEHLAALQESRFDGPFIVGLVGPSEQRAEARDELDRLRKPDRYIEADEGWEQVTLDHVRAYAHENDGAVLYAHTKGAAYVGGRQDMWRRGMTWHVIARWRECAASLSEYDAVGCHWLEFPNTGVNHFSGNFWIATCEILRRLPVCSLGSRHEAECWLGRADPNALDVFPGWPGDVTPPKQPENLLAPLT